MDHQNTNTTLRNKKALADDEIEELELDSYTQNNSRNNVNEDFNEAEGKTQTLHRRDYGNFALLVTLCKVILLHLNYNPLINYLP